MKRDIDGGGGQFVCAEMVHLGGIVLLEVEGWGEPVAQMTAETPAMAAAMESVSRTSI